MIQNFATAAVAGGSLFRRVYSLEPPPDRQAVIADLQFFVGAPEVGIEKIGGVSGAVDRFADEADRAIGYYELSTAIMFAGERPPGDRCDGSSARHRRTGRALSIRPVCICTNALL